MLGALLTDLYQLTMLQASFDRGMNDTATFEFFVRKLPPQRDFLMAAGLAQVLDYLDALRFAPEEIDWLALAQAVDARTGMGSPGPAERGHA